MNSPSPPAASPPVLGVGGVVVNRADGTVLLIRRGKPPRKGQWSLPGGRVERGENIDSALRRELLEETGLSVRPGPLVAVVELIDDAYHYVVLEYLCEVLGGELCAGDDAAEVAFAKIDALADFGVTDAVREVVARALAMRGEAALGAGIDAP
ncbi:MAG: NUDIX hydrolase [Polyangiaceae bacterium]